MSWSRRFERLFWVLGILLLGVWAALKLHSYLGSRRDLERFERAKAAAAAAAPPAAIPSPGPPPPTPVPLVEPRARDYALWSKERIKAYEESLQHEAAPPLGILRIPKIGLEVAVLEGTDDLTLNRGAGHIDQTARPGESGNIGIAAHRDGFFRGLKDVAKGDTMEIETLSRVDSYRITDIWIVKPDDVQVLDATTEPSVTLVACYPFYFVGHAPQRYIVRAVRESRATASRVAAASP